MVQAGPGCKSLVMLVLCAICDVMLAAEVFEIVLAVLAGELVELAVEAEPGSEYVFHGGLDVWAEMLVDHVFQSGAELWFVTVI